MLNKSNIEQMELDFANPACANISSNRPPVRRNAQWWFTQMRRVVSLAIDWKPAPPAPPVQVQLSF